MERLRSLAIYAGRYATLGSIGSYLTLLDDSEYWKMLGISWEVFRSGELKGIGESPLSQAQRDYLQGMVDTSGARIRKNVSKYRKTIAAEDMQGQWFQGDEALARGFCAGNAKDLSAALGKFRKLI
jgi:ClpP class serine protease